MAEFTGITLLAAIALTGVVIAVAFFDLRERRIPNLIVFPAAILGLMLNASRGWQGLWFGCKGLAFGFALLFIPHLFRVMGAGDVKFLAAIGAFVGDVEVVRVLLLALLAYPLLATFFLIRQQKVTLTLKRFARLTSKLFGVFIPPLKFYAAQLEARDDPDVASATSPFGLAISVGTLLALYTNFLR
jgi:prepilin peptidase CpaA